jgi:hypothetical protein
MLVMLEFLHVTAASRSKKIDLRIDARRDAPDHLAARSNQHPVVIRPPDPDAIAALHLLKRATAIEQHHRADFEINHRTAA